MASPMAVAVMTKKALELKTNECGHCWQVLWQVL